jgi:hypothetical protein
MRNKRYKVFINTGAKGYNLETIAASARDAAILASFKLALSNNTGCTRTQITKSIKAKKFTGWETWCGIYVAVVDPENNKTYTYELSAKLDDN